MAIVASVDANERDEHPHEAPVDANGYANDQEGVIDVEELTLETFPLHRIAMPAMLGPAMPEHVKERPRGREGPRMFVSCAPKSDTKHHYPVFSEAESLALIRVLTEARLASFYA